MGTSTVSKNKRSKAVRSALAIALALLLALGGTFAWMSAQVPRGEATNAAFENPGGRMHDDFTWAAADEHNKDVYAENFGEKNIFARVQLREYLEVGAGAAPGTVKNDSDGITEYPADASQSSNAKWSVRGYTGTDPSNSAEPSGYIGLTYGGAADSKWYMPTFNKDNTSSEPDVNGSLRGEDGRIINYANYEAYSSTSKKTADELLPGGETKPGVQHSAQPVPGSSVITMDAWKALDYPLGEFWVYDADSDNGGWFYWAQAIEPGGVTGLLLDDVSLRAPMADDWYYAIDAVGEFVTAEEPIAEGGKYYLNDGVGEDGVKKEISKDAYDLLKYAIDIPAIQDAPIAMDNVAGCEVQLEGKSYCKLAVDDANPNKVMLMTKDLASEPPFNTAVDATNPAAGPFCTAGNQWSKSDGTASFAKEWCNGAYYNNLPRFTKSHIKATTYYTQTSWNDTANFIETTSNVFLLSSFDVFGAGDGATGVDSRQYTYETQLVPADLRPAKLSGEEEESWWWTRSPGGSDASVTIVHVSGRPFNFTSTADGCVRPAFWIDLTPSSL